MKKITVVTGHYGSGKSTFAANYAVRCSQQGERVTVADMDTVNPYYRTADLKALFDENGVELIAPRYAGSNLDMPIIDYDIPGLYETGRNIIIDMGGDDAGAYPLGKFAAFLREHKDETEVLYVVNFCRCLTYDTDGAQEILKEIENACGLKATAVVNNSNLGFETDESIINEGLKKAEKLSAETGIPIFCSTVPVLEKCKDIKGELFPVNIYIRNVWN